MDNNETQDAPLEVMPPSALRALEAAQIDIQIATAHQYPRSLELFKKRALQMATFDLETSESCIYCRPVGKEFNEKTRQWEEKFAEGPSIRMAEIVAVSFGNLRAASQIVEQTPRFVRCEGMAHDLESNTAMKSECVESTVNKKGEPYSERQRALTAKVCLAKAIRDAVFKVVPRALCKPILTECYKVINGEGKPLSERIKRVQGWIDQRRIEHPRVFARLGINGWSDVTEEHLKILTGLKTAIQDGDETIDDVFPPIAITKAPERTGPDLGKGPGSPGPLKTEKKEPPKDQKPPQDAPKAPEGEKTPPKAPETTVQSPAKESEPSKASPEAEKAAPKPAEPEPDEEKALADAGLAPQQQPTTPPAETPAANPAQDPLWVRQQGDTDAIASIRLQAKNAGITNDMLWRWLRAKKGLVKEGQKDLRELSTTKIESLNSLFAKKIDEIKAAK